MGRERRAGDAAAAGRPSDVSRDRLARRVRAEVADVRVRLEEAVLRSDALFATGQPERAAAVLDEQHALLAELQDTIASAVAAASVEAEAENVLFSSPSAVTVFAPPEDAPTSTPPAPAGRVRATASAVASAVAVLALLILGAPLPSPSTVAAVDSDDVADGRAEDDTDGRGSTGTDPTPDGGTTDRDDDRTLGPNELEVRRLFTSPVPSPQGDDGVGVGTGLSGLQALVDQFVATVVRAAGGLAASDAPGVAEDLDPRRSHPSSGDGTPALSDQPDEDGPAASRPTDRPADASEREAASDRSDRSDRSDGDDGHGDEGSDEAPGLPVPAEDANASEDGNAADPGVPPLLE